jgi:Sec7-like guanine-nucleotide exchange factor
MNMTPGVSGGVTIPRPSPEELKALEEAINIGESALSAVETLTTEYRDLATSVESLRCSDFAMAVENKLDMPGLSATVQDILLSLREFLSAQSTLHSLDAGNKRREVERFKNILTQASSKVLVPQFGGPRQ